MKINHDAEIAAALQEQDEGKTFDEQRAAAVAKGKAVAVASVNGRLVAYAAERTDYTAQTSERIKPWRQEMDALKTRLDALERK